MNIDEIKITTRERERVDEILCLYLGYHEAAESLHELAQRSASPLGLLVDYKGQIPQGSGFHYDTIGPKADNAQRMDYRLHQKKQAEYMVQQLPRAIRPFVTAWPRCKNRLNEETGERYTLEEVIKALGVSEPTYKRKVSLGKKYLIHFDMKLNSHLYKVAQ